MVSSRIEDVVTQPNCLWKIGFATEEMKQVAKDE